MYISALTSVMPKRVLYKNNKKPELQNNNEPQKIQYSIYNNKKPSFGFLDPLTLGFIAAYAALAGLACYQTDKEEKARLEEERRITEEYNKTISGISKKLGVSKQDAEEYHYNYLRLAKIPEKNDGNEIGLNAVQGYGIEKYKLAMNLIVPVVAHKKQNAFLTCCEDVPNGVLLYGPTGGGKTYISEKVCEHLKYFGHPVETIVLDNEDHAGNAKRIKEAFENAEKHYNETQQHTIIYFPQDIDNYFVDRRKDREFGKELRTLLNCAENCAQRGAVWISTANNPQMIDSALIRPGRADFKLPIGEMKDFAVADMLKYTLYKYGEKDSAETFDYDSVVKAMKESESVYTPAELELFVSSAKKHKINPDMLVTGDMVIAEMMEYNKHEFPTINEALKASFDEDKKYIEQIDKKGSE